ncbi:MAG: ATP-binding protein, partial [Deltaproteobacteria bacterium]|nr:ATP-binding protein [Deltaproteobacteria bacterium]
LCEGLNLTLEVPREFTPIYVDKDLLRVAINNLLTNAIKYNRKGGSVTLSAEEPEEAICICVRDTGVGISVDDRRRIFDKFFRAGDSETQAASGHGLGLTLANQIVELHGGRIELSSEPGEGSEFSIVLPKNPALLREPAAA